MNFQTRVCQTTFISKIFGKDGKTLKAQKKLSMQFPLKSQSTSTTKIMLSGVFLLGFAESSRVQNMAQ